MSNPNEMRRFRLLKDALADQTSFGTTLLVVMMDLYGPEFMTWTPEVMQLELRDDFQLQLSEELLARLMAAVAIATGEEFYENLRDFISLCNVLSGDELSYEFDPADAEEIAWGITEALLLNPPDSDEEVPFAQEIVGYIGAVLDMEGIMNPPDILRFALRDPNLWSTVQGDFSQDPDMFSAIYDVEQTKTDDINATIRDRMRALLEQLEKLPLHNGSTTEIANRMLVGLRLRHSDQMSNNIL